MQLLARRWAPTYIAFAFDDVEFARYYNNAWNGWYEWQGLGSSSAPFDQPFYIIFNLAIGGSWPGSSNGATPSVAPMYIDWCAAGVVFRLRVCMHDMCILRDCSSNYASAAAVTLNK
jgi:beta-glucanase (GH16 family)